LHAQLITMRAKDTKKVGQMASKAVSKARARHVKPSSPPKESNLGRQIFIYNHLQTNQVVYSLTKSLKVSHLPLFHLPNPSPLQSPPFFTNTRKQNNHALRQLPYNGKKTVPAALRKDLWTPLACINFTAAEAADTASPAQQFGLKTFQKLREYRKLHETQWPESFARDPKTGRTLTRIERGRRLCDQKANSVADMAAALAAVTLRREVKEVEVEVERVGEGGKIEVERVVKKQRVVEPLVRATVQWRDLLDAEFAERWPKTVVHDHWVTTFNNRKLPIMRTELREVEVVKEEAGAVNEVEPVPEPVRNEAGKVVL
jgi:hypothetical protein